MDWGKAKSILIVVFVILNIFLLVNIIGLSRGKDVTSKNNGYTKKILNAHNIKLDCEIPENVSKKIGTYVLATDFNFKKNFYVQNEEDSVKYLGNNKLRLTSKNSELTLENIDEKFLRKQVTSRLKILDGLMDDLMLDYYEKESSEVRAIFVEKKDKFIFYDNIIDIRIAKDEITIECTYNKYESISNTFVNIIPVYQILLKGISNNEKGLTIKAIDLGVRGIHKNLNTDGNQADIEPVWRIKTSDGEKYFVASSGEFVNVAEEEGIK